MTARQADVVRNTKETQITASINLDGTGQGQLNTGMPFLDHMLDQIVRHGLIDINITCQGDIQIDDHHSAEDCGIALGQAFAKLLATKKVFVVWVTVMCP
jgi:imidazoleglycerol-phosphate dehydratase